MIDHFVTIKMNWYHLAILFSDGFFFVGRRKRMEEKIILLLFEFWVVATYKTTLQKVKNYFEI